MDSRRLARNDIVLASGPSRFSFTSHAYMPYSQTIPSDITRTSSEDSRLDIQAINPACLRVEFDYSCLDDLDEQLILRPLDSFADMCWASAVRDYPNRYSTPTQLRRPRPTPNDSIRDVEDSGDSDDSDSSTCHELDEEKLSPLCRKDAVIDESAATSPPYDIGIYHSSYDNDERKSFIFFDPYFSFADPNESVGFFPVQSDTRRKGVSHRLVSFTSIFSGRLIRPGT